MAQTRQIRQKIAISIQYPGLQYPTGLGYIRHEFTKVNQEYNCKALSKLSFLALKERPPSPAGNLGRKKNQPHQPQTGWCGTIPENEKAII